MAIVLEMLILVGLVGGGLALTVLPLWRICKKAGFSGYLSLWALVPIANVVLLFFLAFSDWPALEGKTRAS
jgi:hypothetical protein